MDFIDEVRTRSSNFAKRIDHLDTEEATKQALVLPFVQMLGYAIYDPTEVVPEFTADVGMKKGEKVDYAILQNGRPVLLIECKTYGTTLNEKIVSQLLRYFLTTEARFGILTDGIVYRFFSDLDTDNKMDLEPFFEFNMLDFTEAQVEELKRFTKADFDVDENVIAATALKYTTEIKRMFAQELHSPSKEFIQFILKRVYKGKATQKTLERFNSLGQQAFAQFISEQGSASPVIPSPVEPVSPKPSFPDSEEKEWQPLSTLKPVKGDPKPTGIRFPDSSHRPIKYWRDVSVEAIGWLIQSKLLDSESCPIQRNSRYLVSTKSIHPTGKSFTQPYLIESLYIERNYSAPGHAENTRTVIKHVGQDPAQFAVRFD